MQKKTLNEATDRMKWRPFILLNVVSLCVYLVLKLGAIYLLSKFQNWRSAEDTFVTSFAICAYISLFCVFLSNKYLPDSAGNMQRIFYGILLTILQTILICIIFFASEILDLGFHGSSNGLLLIMVFAAFFYGGANMIMVVYLPKILYVPIYLLLGSGILLGHLAA